MRLGKFSSSGVHKLMKPGRRKGDEFSETALTYIREKRNELRCGREFNQSTDARSLAWGTHVEQYVLKENHLQKPERVTNHNLNLTGEADFLSEEVNSETGKYEIVVGDIKCPWTLSSFALMYEIENAEQLKAQKPEYYWQLISNTILYRATCCELFIFVPRYREVEDIVAMNPPDDGGNYYFLTQGHWEQFPYIDDLATAQVPHVINFIPPAEDVELLVDKLQKANKLL